MLALYLVIVVLGGVGWALYAMHTNEQLVNVGSAVALEPRSLSQFQQTATTSGRTRSEWRRTRPKAATDGHE